MYRLCIVSYFKITMSSIEKSFFVGYKKGERVYTLLAKGHIVSFSWL